MKIQWTETAPRGNSWAQRQGTLAFAEDLEGVENQVVNLYPRITYQTFEGFGGAATDAAGSVYAQLNPEQKKQLVQTYFAPDQMGYTKVRVPMDSCDFSTGMYEALSDLQDRALDSFSFARTEQYILPLLEDAQAAAGKPLQLMLSPWSPPAFMKTNSQRTYGGKLKPEFADFWADYICRYIREFQKSGFQVQRISIQNEPKAVQTWDSCLYTAEEEGKFLLEHLHPAMESHGLSDIEVFVWDHNKERLYERVRDAIRASSPDLVSGGAFHWYSGDHFEALDLVRQAYPNMKLITSESCIEYRFYGAGDEWANCARLTHELMGDLNHGISAFYDWNLLLDERGGPNHVGNWCYAPFFYHRDTKVLQANLCQAFYWHFSHFIRPGAKRIALTKYTDQLEATAFQNPDGAIGLVLFNRDQRLQTAHIRLNEQIATFELPGHGMLSGFISG